MGTDLFSEITIMNISHMMESKRHCYKLHYEHSKNQIKASLHFDSDRGFGVIVNYTGRNILR